MGERWIYFDADDTLWDNEGYFRSAEAEFAHLLSRDAEAAEVQEKLWAKQEENIPYFGYGSKTYMLGMTDTAIELCGGVLRDEIYHGIKDIILRLAHHGFDIIDGVEDTLQTLRQAGYSLAVATKGDLTEQMAKYRKSGLDRFFHHIEVLENKDEKNYLELCHKHNIAPEDFVMVGNSVKSDIAPVIAIGGWAYYIPHDIVWSHEFAPMPESQRVTEVATIRDLPRAISANRENL